MARQYTYTVKSDTHGLRQLYTLTVEHQIVIHCTCKGFEYRGVCKHQIKKQQEICKRLGIDVEAVAQQAAQDAAAKFGDDPFKGLTGLR